MSRAQLSVLQEFYIETIFKNKKYGIWKGKKYRIWGEDHLRIIPGKRLHPRVPVWWTL